MPTAAEVRDHLHHFGGRPCLALVNTVLWRRGEARDIVDGYPALLRWAVAVGMLGDADGEALRARAERDPDGAARALAHVRAVRELLYGVFERVAAGAAPDEPDLAELNALIAEAGRHAVVVRCADGYGWAFAGAGEDLEAPLWAPLRSAGETLVGEDLTRLKQCPGPTCGWIFLDETRSRTRRWCEPGECGNRQRARDYYARRRASA